MAADGSSDGTARRSTLGLLDIVLRAQQVYLQWQQAETPEAQKIYRDQFQATTEELWHALADDLRRVARGWKFSGMGPDNDTLAMGMFVHIITALPKLKVDPQRDVRKYLITVARNNNISEYRRVYARQPIQMSEERASHETEMWANSSYQDDRAEHQRMIGDQGDHEPYDSMNHLDDLLDRRTNLERIWQYWKNTLSQIDYQIMDLRWHSEPPTHFQTIAAHLGPGWSADSVRQRHYRVCKDTRLYFQQQGLLDSFDTS